jgi:hypothetical protein
MPRSSRSMGWPVRRSRKGRCRKAQKNAPTANPAEKPPFAQRRVRSRAGGVGRACRKLASSDLILHSNAFTFQFKARPDAFRSPC